MRTLIATLIGISCIILIGCSPQSADESGQHDLTPKIMNDSLLQFQVSGYENGGRIPAKFATVAGGGKNVSIGLAWQTLPAAQSYALLFDDKHPVAKLWVHWLVVDIPNTVTEIAEGASRAGMPAGSRELVTSWGKTGYDGPQPPVGSGDHEYVATLYALDVPKLSIDENASRSDFIQAIERHVIAEESWRGWFER